MRCALFAFCIVLPAAAWAECPKGTEQTLNDAGVPNCITVAPRAAPAPPASQLSCPSGSTRYSEFNGETVCKRLDTGQEFFNQTVGCPIGTFPAIDVSGSRICRR